MLHETERPKTWADFVGNEKALAKAKAITNRAKSTGNPFALWIDGPSGTGKTTLAKIVGNLLDPSGLGTQELDGPQCDGRSVASIRDSLATRSFVAGGWRVIRVDEAHNQTPKAIQNWLTALENLPTRCAVLFTTTENVSKQEAFGPFTGPLLSRCIRLSLTNQGLADVFAIHAQALAEKHGLGGAEPKEYLNLVRKHKNNMRAVLSEIEGFEMAR